MQSLADGDDRFEAGFESVVNEIGVARFEERAAEIVFSRRRGVVNLAAADVNAAVIRIVGLRFDVENLRRVQSAAEGGERDDDLKNGTRRVPECARSA